MEKIAKALEIELEQFFRFGEKVTEIEEMNFLEKINYELRSRTEQEQEAVYHFIKQLLWFRDKQ